MKAAFKAEFRKLLTVRSTYFILALALLLIGFISFYAQGYRLAQQNQLTNMLLADSILNIASAAAVFAAIVVLLLLTHEYRYNTIVYALTTSNNRSKVLLAKILTSMAYVAVVVVLCDVIGLSMMVAGVHAAGHSLPSQDFSWLTYLAKSLFYGEAYALAALLFAALLRNQVASLAVLFIVPGTVEGLLGLVLKSNAVYMPFTALSQVIQSPAAVEARRRFTDTGHLSPLKGAAVFGIYLVVGWAIAWYLFLKRDAN